MAATTCLSYYPSELDAIRYWQSESTREKAHNVSVPAGYPAQLRSPLAWTREDALREQADWVLELTAEDVEDVDRAITEFQASAQPLSHISQKTFKLSASLTQRLRESSDQCYKGLGFKIIRGVDPSRYTAEQNVILYAGISSYIGSRRGYTDGILQDAVVAHILNVAGDNQSEKAHYAPGFTDTSLAFHTDNCEIMGLYCLQTAVHGGVTQLSSAWNVYNQLASTRPEVLHTLAEPWVLDTFKDYNIWKPISMPFLDRADTDHVLLRFSRYPIVGWKQQRNQDLPAPTSAQLAAIDAVQFVAAADSIRFSLARGDILYVNDMAVMHGREEFDESGAKAKRHLLKMFVSDPDQHWPVAPSARWLWDKMYGPNRPDGDRDETWHLHHAPGLENTSMVNG